MLEKRGNYWYGEKWFLCSSKNGFCLALVWGCFVVDSFFLLQLRPFDNIQISHNASFQPLLQQSCCKHISKISDSLNLSQISQALCKQDTVLIIFVTCLTKRKVCFAGFAVCKGVIFRVLLPLYFRHSTHSLYNVIFSSCQI